MCQAALCFGLRDSYPRCRPHTSVKENEWCQEQICRDLFHIGCFCVAVCSVSSYNQHINAVLAYKLRSGSVENCWRGLLTHGLCRIVRV
jgi:hypothetical protein